MTRRLPHCDLTPLALPLPPDVRLCFWCRRDLLEFADGAEIDDDQVTLWLAHWLKLAAIQKSRNLPLRRCDVGTGRDRCTRFAKSQRDGLWVCGKHAQARYAQAPRHYLDWRCQRTVYVGQIAIAPPRQRLPRPQRPVPDRSQRGERNGNAALTDDDVVAIRQLIAQGEYNTTIAKKFGVTHSLISLIRRQKIWTHVA